MNAFGYGSKVDEQSRNTRGDAAQVSHTARWILPRKTSHDKLTNAKKQIESKLRQGSLELPVNQPLTVFSITNAVGGVMHGELILTRTDSSESLGTAEAIIRKHSATAMKGGVMLFFKSQSVPGARLIIKPAPGDEAAQTMFSYSDEGSAFNGTAIWTWSDGMSDEAIAAAMVQLNRHDDQNPLTVTAGQTVEAFSVTNATGRFYRGLFELLAPEANGQ